MAHVYCGDPSVEFSEKLIKVLEPSIDILELGIPFSDPIADGKVFQQACQRALEKGVTPKDVFSVIERLKNSGFKKQIVLTTYYNIIFKMGISVFVDILAELGIYGVIVPDLSLEESLELKKACEEKKIHLIYLIAPTTTEERIKKILELASGFVYIVSTTGVTGTKKKAKNKVKKVIQEIRKCSQIPLLIGFGISKPEDITELKELDVNGFIVGSQICRLYQKGDLKEVREFAEKIRGVCG